MNIILMSLIVISIMIIQIKSIIHLIKIVICYFLSFMALKCKNQILFFLYDLVSYSFMILIYYLI